MSSKPSIASTFAISSFGPCTEKMVQAMEFKPSLSTLEKIG
jgi:hypothetical protein